MCLTENVVFSTVQSLFLQGTPIYSVHADEVQLLTVFTQGSDICNFI